MTSNDDISNKDVEDAQHQQSRKAAQYDELLLKMKEKKEQWDAEERASKKKSGSSANKDDDDDDDDEQYDRLLQEAIDFSIQQGRGWKPGEKEKYLEQILDDDFIPPLFCSTPEELQRTGLQDAFTSLAYDENESPASLVARFKQRGTDAYLNGKRNTAKNQQYYRDAINAYYEAYAWSQRITPIDSASGNGDKKKMMTNVDANKDETAQQQPEQSESPLKEEKDGEEEEEQQYTPAQLNQLQATICSNIALMHIQLGNWGYCCEECDRSIGHDKTNTKAWYRRALAQSKLQQYEQAQQSIDTGLATICGNVISISEQRQLTQQEKIMEKELRKLQKQIHSHVVKAKRVREQREQARKQRSERIQRVWDHCQSLGVALGRLPLVTSVSEEEEEDRDDNDDAAVIESKWHSHMPHTGKLPSPSDEGRSGGSSGWSWPVMFLYPSHEQSDFIAEFQETTMMAMQLAEMFPELEDDDRTATTKIGWDINNEYTCSQLSIYFEVHEKKQSNNNTTTAASAPHPETVQQIPDKASCVQLYESVRALLGDEGDDMSGIVRAVERKRLYQQRKAWLRANNKPTTTKWSPYFRPTTHLPVVRVHPAMTLADILQDHRMMVPNFLVTFILFPENHPAHHAFLKERECVGILQPKGLQ